MKPLIPLRQALTDPAILGKALGAATWRNWRVLLMAAMGEPLTPDELETFRKLAKADGTDRACRRTVVLHRPKRWKKPSHRRAVGLFVPAVHLPTCAG